MGAKFSLALAISLSLSLFSAPLLAQTDEEARKKAAQLFSEAEIHYKLQEFSPALEKYKEAYRLSQEPALLFNLGQCYRQMGEYKTALGMYKAFLRDAPDTPLRKDIEALIAELDDLIEKTKTVEKAPPNPTISEKGEDKNPAANPVVSNPEAGSSKNTPAATQPSGPEDPTSTDKGGRSPLLLYGAAAGSAVLGLGFGGLAFSSARQAKNAQNQDVSDIDLVASKFKSARIMGLVADVLLVTAVATGVGGFLVGKKKASGAETRVSLTPTGVSLVAEF